MKSERDILHLKILCHESVPKPLPVIPWYPLVACNEDPPHDKPYIQIIKTSSITSLSGSYAKYQQSRNMKALLVIGKIQKQTLKEILTSIPTLIIIPSEQLGIIEEAVRSHSISPLLVSCIPLTFSETTARSSKGLNQNIVSLPITLIYLHVIIY